MDAQPLARVVLARVVLPLCVHPHGASAAHPYEQGQTIDADRTGRFRAKKIPLASSSITSLARVPRAKQCTKSTLALLKRAQA